MRAATMIACLAAIATVAHASPDTPPEQLAWTPGLPAAQDAARARKVPLLVVLNLDQEPGNERMVAEVYTAPALREAAKRCVVTIASIGRHAAVDDPKTGRKLCAKFGLVTCDEHRATEETVRTDWLRRGPKDDVESPRHIFRAPDGRLLFERVWTLEAPELVKLIDRAVLACTPESLAAWDTVEARLQRAFEPLACVRSNALRELLAAHDPAVDAKLFDLVRRTESAEAAADVVRGIAADMTPTRAEGVRKLLASPSAVVRMQAAAAIAALKEKDAFDVLNAAYGHEKAADVKCVMLRAIAVCRGDPAKTHDLLLKTAKSGEGPVRNHAIVALAPWAAEDAVVAALRKLPENDKLPENLRAAAMWTLGLSGRKEIADELRPLGESKSRLLQSVAAAATARLAGGKADPNYGYLRNWIAPLDVYLPEDATK